MADHTKPAFPSDTTTLSTLTVCPHPFPLNTARGPDAFRPGYIYFPEAVVTASADQDYQPISAITVQDCRVAPYCPPFTIPGGLDMGTDAIDRVSWWLLELGYVNDSAGNDGQPPDIDYEIRAAMGRRANRIVSGTSAFTSYDNNGFFVQVAGILSTEFELWARVNPFQVGVTVGTQIRVRFGVIADRNGGTHVDADGLGIVSVMLGELGGAV